MGTATASRIDEWNLLVVPCPRCGRVESDPGALEPYGVSRDRTGRPVLIMYHCRCRTTRSLRWEDAPPVVRRKAEACFLREGDDTNR
jgi:hypothetical protein